MRPPIAIEPTCGGAPDISRRVVCAGQHQQFLAVRWMVNLPFNLKLHVAVEHDNQFVGIVNEVPALARGGSVHRSQEKARAAQSAAICSRFIADRLPREQWERNVSLKRFRMAEVTAIASTVPQATIKMIGTAAIGMSLIHLVARDAELARNVTKKSDRSPNRLALMATILPRESAHATGNALGRLTFLELSR
jgi:hypothetical protein